MENNTLCNRHSLGVNNHTKMYVTYTRIYGWSDYGGESSYQPRYRLENMMWMTLLVYDYIIPGEICMAEGITAAEMLQQVNEAITNVLVGGQSYQIGSRKLTRADLSMLRTLKKELQAEVSAEGESSILDNTYVVMFDGR